jgi:hypothetical protein
MAAAEPTPQWILDILKNVSIPPPPIYVVFCQMCGVRREFEDRGLTILPSFCEACKPKYDEYCHYVNFSMKHAVQQEALSSAVYVYDPGNGKKVEQ